MLRQPGTKHQVKALRYLTLPCFALWTFFLANHAMAEFSYGGYLKLDVLYDRSQDLGNSLDASALDTSVTFDNNQIRMHVLETRAYVGHTREKTQVYLEVELFDADMASDRQTVTNSYSVNIRHAYGVIKNGSSDLLVGQTWSTAMDKFQNIYPVTLDFNGPAGATFIRQAQVRWSQGNWDFALENSENIIKTTAPATSSDIFPDIVVRYAVKKEFTWQVVGMLRSFEVSGGSYDGETEVGPGLSAGLNIPMGNNSISAAININNGRYMYYGWANPEAFQVAQEVEFTKQIGTMFAINHNWGGEDNTLSTFAIGRVTYDHDLLLATDIDTISTMHLNYRWQSVDHIELGGEVSFARRQDIGGATAENIRLQFSIKFLL